MAVLEGLCHMYLYNWPVQHLHRWMHYTCAQRVLTCHFKSEAQISQLAHVSHPGSHHYLLLFHVQTHYSMMHMS